MTIQEFADIFLPSLSYKYNNREVGLKALVDLDTWQKVFPDSNETGGHLLWYQIKLNSFVLDDGTGLIVYSLPEPHKAGERKFIGLRFDNKTHHLNYYVLVRPKFYDATWEIYRYSFPTAKFEFECMIIGTSALRNFVDTINQIIVEKPKGIIEMMKGLIKDSFQMQS